MSSTDSPNLELQLIEFQQQVENLSYLLANINLSVAMQAQLSAELATLQTEIARVKTLLQQS